MVRYLRHRIIEEALLPIRRVQTDRGGEFVRMFQEVLQHYWNKFRLTRPRAPHFNGRVERSQRTDPIGITFHRGYAGLVAARPV